jgi:hypothetical protein
MTSKIAESKEYGTEGFVLKIQRFICRAIYKAILISNQTSSLKYLVDWDGFIFDEMD